MARLTNQIKKLVKILWKLYKTTCIGLVTLFVLVYCYGLLTYPFHYLELPNGLRLAQSIIRDIGYDGFILKDETGKFILSAKDGEIAYQGEFVFGMASPVKSGDNIGSSFVHKRGWTEPMIFNNDSGYRDTLDKYNLRGSIQIPLNLSERESYKECTKHYGTLRCDFKAYDEYWHNIESEKEERYQCERNSKETCHSYGIYKTYLSLKRLPEFRKNWYD